MIGHYSEDEEVSKCTFSFSIAASVMSCGFGFSWSEHVTGVNACETPTVHVCHAMHVK